jgi:hypothetical protein
MNIGYAELRFVAKNTFLCATYGTQKAKAETAGYIYTTEIGFGILYLYQTLVLLG